jgi:hypothetical protein
MEAPPGDPAEINECRVDINMTKSDGDQGTVFTWFGRIWKLAVFANLNCFVGGSVRNLLQISENSELPDSSR